ncbi:MAG: peptidyl-prolyl cis-trans isomerase [Acidobacteriota bacterium]
MNVLKFMRRTKSMKILLWLAIAAFILLIFAVWGGGAQGERGGLFQNYSVKVESESLPYGSLTLQVLMYQRQLQNMLGQAYKDSFMRGAPIVQAQQLVNTLILDQLAHRYGLRVSDTELADSIQKMFGFRNPAKEYPQMLAKFGTNAKDFEALMRAQLLAGKVMDLISNSQFFSDKELKRLYHEQHDRYKAALAVARFSDFEDKIVDVPDSEIKALYEKEKGSLNVPEKRAIKYLYFTINDIRNTYPVSDAEVKAYYNAHKSDFAGAPFKTVEFQVKQTMLLSDPALSKKVQQAYDKARNELQNADDAAALEALAKKLHLNVLTSDPFAENGSIGQIGPDKGLAKAVFNTKKDVWSPMMKVQGGVARFEVTRILPAHTATLEEAKPKLETQWKKQKAESEAKAVAKELAADATDAKTLEAAAKKTGAIFTKTGELGPTKPLPIVGKNRELAAKLAEAPEGQVIGPERTKAGYLVAVILEHQPADMTKFEQDKAQFAESQAQQAAQQFLNEYVVRRRDELQKDNDIQVNMKELKWLEKDQGGGGPG